MGKPLITSIGVIDREQSLHRDFALRALDYKIDRERVFNYELFKEEQHDLLHIAHQRINQYISEIMYLKVYG